MLCCTGGRRCHFLPHRPLPKPSFLPPSRQGWMGCQSHATSRPPNIAALLLLLLLRPSGIRNILPRSLKTRPPLERKVHTARPLLRTPQQTMYYTVGWVLCLPPPPAMMTNGRGKGIRKPPLPLPPIFPPPSAPQPHFCLQREEGESGGIETEKEWDKSISRRRGRRRPFLCGEREDSVLTRDPPFFFLPPPFPFHKKGRRRHSEGTEENGGGGEKEPWWHSGASCSYAQPEKDWP